MKHRILRILPPLLHQARCGSPRVLDKAVAVPVTPAIDPLQCSLDMRPQRRRERAITGPIEIRPGEDDEKWCRVDAAVIAAEWHLAEPRHLAVPSLMQDFSGLGVLFAVDAVRLGCGKVRQDALREPRIHPEG